MEKQVQKLTRMWHRKMRAYTSSRLLSMSSFFNSRAILIATWLGIWNKRHVENSGMNYSSKPFHNDWEGKEGRHLEETGRLRTSNHRHIDCSPQSMARTIQTILLELQQHRTSKSGVAYLSDSQHSAEKKSREYVVVIAIIPQPHLYL